MQCIILWSVTCPAVQHVSALSHKWCDFWENFDFVYNFCLKFSKMLLNIGIHVKYPLVLSDFNQTWIFVTDFWKILKCEISWKSIRWKLNCSMWMDGQTDWHDKANSHLSQFCKCARQKRKWAWEVLCFLRHIICHTNSRLLTLSRLTTYIYDVPHS
jgi:hypothetical protein